MNGIVNGNKITVVKGHKIDNPLIQNIDSINDKCYRDCQHKYFHTFVYECVYNLNFTNINNNETVNLTNVGENMAVYELNKKLSIARERGFIFNEINNFKNKNL